MIRIGEFSKMTQTTVKALRYYDEMGLLKPELVDDETGYRYYTTGQLLPLHRVVSLRQAGLSVAEVRSVLSGQELAEILNARKARLEGQLQDIRGQLSHIQFLLDHYEEDYRMKYQAIVKDLPACTVCYKQGVVPNFAAFGDFIQQADAEFRAAVRFSEPDYCFVSHLDPEFRHENVHIEYAQAVPAPGKETDVVHYKQLDSVPAVCVYHKGPYDGLHDAYTFAYQWVADNGYVPAGSARQRYIDGIWNKKEPEQWLTELQIPVRRK